jgi:hypothetical protein
VLYLQGNTGEIQTSNTPERDRPQHDRPKACVTAQQYSSAIFISLRFPLQKKKFGSCLKMILFHFWLLLTI